METRRIEERAEFANGIKCEWEPSTVKAASDNAAEVRLQVIQLNRKAKKEGSWLKYRSVVDD